MKIEIELTEAEVNAIRNTEKFLFRDIADKIRAQIPPKQPHLKSLLPEDTSERCGWKWFSLRKGHPFESACKRHDRYFELKEAGKTTQGRQWADEELRRDMLAIAHVRNSRWLKFQAYVLYGIARATGRLFW